MPGGDTPGRNASEEERTAWSFSLLLTADDLPGGGWRVIEERSWPTGQRAAARAESRRAADSGGMTAWRKLVGPDHGEAWVEVVPYASAADALVSRDGVSTYFVGVVPEGETIVEERVEVRPVSGLVDPWILDKTTSGAAGDRRARTVAGALGSALVLTCLAGPVDRWTWEDVLGLAALQADRIARSISS